MAPGITCEQNSNKKILQAAIGFFFLEGSQTCLISAGNGDMHTLR
jgi:hypothetical protein